MEGGSAGTDGGLDDDWDAAFIIELIDTVDELDASRNPNPTPTPTPAPAPIPTCGPSAATPDSYLPAAPHPSPPLRFSPPPRLSERPPLPPPAAAASARDACGFSPPRVLSQAGRGFSPTRDLSQPQAPEEGSLAIVAVSGSAGDQRFVGTGVGAERDREARELERLKRDLNRVSEQVKKLKNECTELRKDKTKKDLQIKAKEAEIQNLKKANVSSKDICSAGMDIDQSFHTPANGALHAGGSSRTSTRRTYKMNGKDKDVHSLRDDLYLKEGHQTDLPEALELRCRTMTDNGTSTSGVVSLEENTHFEQRSITCKEIKAIGVQTDKRSDNEHFECNKVLVEHISSNLRAMWGMSSNSLSRGNLISKIIVSCSEEILSLLQCTRLSDNCEPSYEPSSSMNEAISQVYDMFIKMNSGRISIQTFLEALLNLCAFDNTAIVGRTLRVLLRVLQHLLHHGAKSSGRNNVSVEPYVNIHTENNHKDCLTLLSPLDADDLLQQHNMFLPFTLWSSLFTAMLQIGVKYSEETIRTDALSIMILIVRSTDPKEERHKFGFTSVMTRLHLLMQKGNGLLVKKHSVRLLFLLLNCPVMLKLLCSGGKDGSEQMESEACENNRSKELISSVLADLSDCLTSEATCSLGIELCRLVIILLAYIASSGKLGYEVLLGPVNARGASFLEMIMEVLASQMQYETQELLKERCLVMREALILLNRLASHTNYSKPTLEMLTRSKICATLTIDVANRLPQIQMANDLAELAQKFRSRVYAFLEEKPLAVEGSSLGASNKS
ncbi:uncharacterized protein LOC8055087 isoform X2 [Sorghum bicolor]|uniref:uncharacterized protein LOC8055087 isoform X2 n=1 Tax=Sorghum bicolor TaxID=4558 RepID=UPI000B424A10|nr:uncharacterized protein LOC8055087 isoform X2 [Sorghum bicolor]|eukprot:XP_021314709.1 uncharacterized protein LOC8055087 isoform X2 [Sorghum bicolor]